MEKRLKLTWRFVLLIAALLASVAVTATFGLRALGRLDAALDSVVKNDMERLLAITHTRRLFRSLVVIERDYLLSSSAAQRDLLERDLKSTDRELVQQMNKYQRLMPAGDEGALTSIRQVRTHWLELDQRVLSAAKAGSRDAVALAARHAAEPVSWELVIGRLIQDNEKRLEREVAETHAMFLNARSTLMAAALWAALVAAGLGTAIYMGIQNNLRQVLDENAHRRVVEAELSASRAHLHNVLEHMVDGVIAADTTGRITLVNRPFEALTGVTRFELEATPFAKLASAIRLGTTDAAVFSEADLPLRRALRGETCLDVPATFVHAGSDRRAYVRISSAPILGATGEVMGAVSVLHDLTPTAQLELMKDQFIQVAAHELKTPITVIRMGAQQLLRTPATQVDAIRERAEVLARGTDRIQRIVDALLLLSSLQRGRLKLALEDVDLAALLVEVAGEAARVSGRPIRVRTEAALVRGDRERLKHVLAQIVDNAIKYSPGGEEVAADMARTESDVLVRVRDRGVGIPRDKRDDIFQRFFRAHTDTPYDRGGMGVGLYLSQAIAREHGGGIWFESTEGGGSTFHLRLPCLR